MKGGPINEFYTRVHLINVRMEKAHPMNLIISSHGMLEFKKERINK
jgi:hypothetical protein